MTMSRLDRVTIRLTALLGIVLACAILLYTLVPDVVDRLNDPVTVTVTDERGDVLNRYTEDVTIKMTNGHPSVTTPDGTTMVYELPVVITDHRDDTVVDTTDTHQKD